MSYAKELLFSCVVMMHVSFVVMQPLDKQSLYKSLENFCLPLGNLRLAEQSYVKLILQGDRPTEYDSSTWNLSERITFGNTTEEIQASVCAIIDYLGNHLPNHLQDHLPNNDRSLTGQFDNHRIIANVNRFLRHFKAAVKPTVELTQCTEREIETTHRYARKKMGLHILYSSRRWVEHFIKIDCLRD